MDRAQLDDPAAVAAMAAGDPVGLESVYRRYADRLHAYARSIVGDADTASDVVQETFLTAQERVRQLRDPARLASWLYAIARNECLSRLRARKRTVMLGDSDEPVLDTDPGRAVHAEQVRELVHAAAAGMNDGDREVFELTVRHGLPAAEVGRVLGVSDNHAHARISRARSQFEGALGALVLARDGRGRCEGLDAVLSDWDGSLTILTRKRIERHAKDCVVCTDRRRERMNPAGLLAAYTALPFVVVVDELWPRFQLIAAHGRGAGSVGQDGRSGRRPSRSAAVAAGIAVLLLLGGVAVPVALNRLKPQVVAAEPSAGPSLAPPEASASPSASATPSPTASPSESTAPSPSTTAVVPFAATAAVQTSCLNNVTFRLQVTVQATGGTLSSARLYWKQAPTTTGGLATPVTTYSAGMTVNGQSASRTVSSQPKKVLWWVVVTAADGRQATTPQKTASTPCPPPAG